MLRGVSQSGGGGGSNGPALPTITAMSSIAATTSATATTGAFVAFTAAACTEVWVDNQTGVELEFIRNSDTTFVSLKPGQFRRFVGLTNASQLSVRRTDWTDSTDFSPGPARTTDVSAMAVTSTEAFSLAAVLNIVLSNGGGGNDLPFQPCSGLEMINNTGKHLKYRTSASAPYNLLRSGGTAIILGISNANQVHLQPADSVVDLTGRPLMVECFTSGLREALSKSQPETVIAAEARILMGDMKTPSKMSVPTDLTIAEIARGPKRNLRAKKVKSIVQFTNKANMTASSGVSASIDATDGEILFGSSHVEYTQTAFGTYNFAPLNVLSTPVNVNNGMIRITVCFPYGPPDFSTKYSGAMSTLRVQLFSAGSPAAVGANYHQASLTPGGFVSVSQAKRTYSFSIHVSQLSMVGTGADLSAITWARFQLNTGSAGNGAKFRPIAIDFVPNVLSKAIVVFTNDDFHEGCWNVMMPILAKYGYPAVMCGDSFAALEQGTGLTLEQVRILREKYGWQVANQNYNNETGVAKSNERMVQEHAKYNLFGLSTGISDMEDTSSGFATYTNIRDDNMPAIRRMYRSNMLFLNGTNTTPPMTFGETAPFGDPYRIRRLNMTGFTAGTFYDRFKDHVDQAVAAKGVALFACHTEFNVGAVNGAEFQSAFASLVDYIKTLDDAGSVEVLTIAEAIEKIYPR